MSKCILAVARTAKYTLIPHTWGGVHYTVCLGSYEYSRYKQGLLSNGVKYSTAYRQKPIRKA